MNNFKITIAPKDAPQFSALYDISSLKSKDDFYNDWEKAKDYAKIGDQEDYFDSIIDFMNQNGYRMEVVISDYIEY